MSSRKKRKSSILLSWVFLTPWLGDGFTSDLRWTLALQTDVLNIS
ncbi:MAG: hypothetical protein U7123_06415 [Potamolinea sp.]